MTHIAASVTEQPEGDRRQTSYGIASTNLKQKDDVIGLTNNAIIGSTTRVPEKTSP